MPKTLAVPGDMFPGAGPAVPVPQDTDAGLLHGVYGLCIMTGITILHLFDWQVTVTQKLLDVTAHGDEWEQWIQLRQGWTGRAKGYLTRSGVNHYIAGAAKLSGVGPPLTFTGYSDMGEIHGASPGPAGVRIIIAGEILYEELTIQVPNAMVTQEITFRGSVAPTGGPAA